MELILWRHAEAEDGHDDMARKLTPKGHKQAIKMADWLNVRLPKECRILSSPTTRALQTAEALGRDVKTLSTLAPGARVEALLNIACWPGNQHDWTLITGHQPDLGAAAAFLLGSDGSLSIKKAGVWWFSSRHRDGLIEVVLRAVLAPDMV